MTDMPASGRQKPRFPLAAALPVLALAVLAGLYWLYWSAMADRIRAGAVEWTRAQAGRGVEVTWQAMRVRGFPMQLRLELDDLTARAAGPAPWAVFVPELHINALPYRLDHLIASARTPMRVEHGPAGARRAFEVTAGSAQASYVADAGGADRVAVDLQTLRAIETTGPARLAAARLTAARLTAARLQLHARRVPGLAGALDVAVRAEDVRLEAGIAPELVALLGPEIGRAAAQARLIAGAGDGVFRDPGRLPEEGGVLKISESFVYWGPARLRLAGTLDMTPEGRLNGRLETRLQGVEAVMAGLAREGWISADAQGPLKAAVSLLSAMSGGGADGVRLPVTIRDGAVYAGPVRVR